MRFFVGHKDPWVPVGGSRTPLDKLLASCHKNGNKPWGVIVKQFARILACTDFSDVGNRAVEMAFGLVHVPGDTVHLAHVLDAPAMPNPMYAHYVSKAVWEPEELERVVAEATKALKALIPPAAAKAGVGVQCHAFEGNPAGQILHFIGEHEIEVVVLGTHGRTGLERFILGSVTERVVRMASCAVMVVH